jgi:hypothetical protein
MTDQEKIARQLGITVAELSAPTAAERDRTLEVSLTNDERTLARQLGMSPEDIAEMVTERATDIEPEEASERLKLLGKEGQGRLLALSAAAAYRLFSQASKREAKWSALREATADLIRASGGRVPAR